MAFSTMLKRRLNAFLIEFGIQLETLTAERLELARLQRVSAGGGFDMPVFPILAAVQLANVNGILNLLRSDQGRTISRRINTLENFDSNNTYFTTPDAEVLVAIVELYQPSQIIEVGSGNSTRLFREAVGRSEAKGRITSIDPFPRRDVKDVADEIIDARVEDCDSNMFSALQPSDILFIDSSHEIKAGNDVVHLFLRILPFLRPGVIVHVHDVFLPYEYPREWIIDSRWPWTEQYLLQALLQGSADFEVLWAGHYLQRTLADFDSYFPFLQDQVAKSFWMIKT